MMRGMRMRDAFRQQRDQQRQAAFHRYRGMGFSLKDAAKMAQHDVRHVRKGKRERPKRFDGARRHAKLKAKQRRLRA